MTTLSRRQILAGGSALALLTACGGSGSDETSTVDERDGDSAADPTTGGTDTSIAGGVLLQMLPPQGVLTATGEQRVPIAIAGTDGVPLRDGLQPLDFTIRMDQGEPRVLTVEPRTDGIPTPYYPLRFQPPGTGILEISADGFTPMTFDIGTSTPIPTVGSPLPAVATPTVRRAGGVDPICTRDPACDLHGVSLDDALDAGGPIVLSIATPEFCQTAICGPVLDLLLEALPDYPTVTGIHTEVYADPRGGADPTAGGLAPIAEQYALPFEPTLYVVDAGGVVIDRLDSVYDRAELREALDRIA